MTQYIVVAIVDNKGNVTRKGDETQTFRIPNTKQGFREAGFPTTRFGTPIIGGRVKRFPTAEEYKAGVTGLLPVVPPRV